MGIKYSEDPYERKEDISREELAKLNGKILYGNHDLFIYWNHRQIF